MSTKCPLCVHCFQFPANHKHRNVSVTPSAPFIQSVNFSLYSSTVVREQKRLRHSQFTHSFPFSFFLCPLVSILDGHCGREEKQRDGAESCTILPSSSSPFHCGICHCQMTHIRGHYCWSSSFSSSLVHSCLMSLSLLLQCKY